MMAEPDTEDGEKLDVVVALIRAYEARLFPWICLLLLKAANLRSSVKCIVKDLEPMIGKSNRV